MQPSALAALWSTYKEILDSKKWVGSYVQCAVAVCLVQFLGWSITDALLVTAGLTVAVVAQAHVDGKGATKVAPSIAGPVIGELKTTAPTTLATVPAQDFETETPPQSP